MPRKSKKTEVDIQTSESASSTSNQNTDRKEWFVAIDPGKCNFAFIIEEINHEMLEKLTCPTKKDRFVYKPPENEENEDANKKEKKRKKKGENMEPSSEYTSFLEKFYHCGKTILCENNDITGGVKSAKKGSKSIDSNTFLKLTELLDSYKEYWDKCSTIIIEQQMSFGKSVNTMAIKIAQHTHSYFLFRYGNTKNIIEFPSYHKTQTLGAPSGLDKPKRKKWAVEKADEIWALRGDMESCSKVGSKKKKDDMSDCLLHVLSYIILNKIG